MKKKSPSGYRASPRNGARLGQHFLTSRAIARRVAEAGNIAPGEAVLEVGPGKGMLTRELVAFGARVIAVEKDPTMVAILEREFADEILRTDLHIIEGDMRELDPSTLYQVPRYKVIANIPYYLTGELIRMFLTTVHQPTTIVFLVQKEVAERIVKSKKESLLSLSVKAFGTPRYVRTVKAGSFSPPPSVDSAILAIDNISRERFDTTIPVRPGHPGGYGYSADLEKKFFTLLHAGFGQKRKTLMGNLKKAELYRASMNLDPKIRAEDVPLEAWLQLAQLSQT